MAIIDFRCSIRKYPQGGCISKFKSLSPYIKIIEKEGGRLMYDWSHKSITAYPNDLKFDVNVDKIKIE